MLGRTMNYDKYFSASARTARRSEIREILKLTRKPEFISFAGGLPAPDTFPVELLGDICRDVLDERGETALQYGLTEGELELRNEIRKWVARDSVEVAAEQVFITNGSQQGLDLLGRVLLDPDDTIIVELPSYIGGLQAFRFYKSQMLGVPQDDGGMRIDLLETRLKELADKGTRPKFIYVVPDFQNPSGVTMPDERRIRLLELAREYDTLVVEDTPYRELRFTGVDQAPLFALDDDERVITLTTFSKIFCPGFRLAWMLAPTAITAKLNIARQSTDLCSPSFNQAVVAEFMAQGKLAEQVAIIKEKYAAKREIMLEELARRMPNTVSWTKPEGGLFLWVVLPDGMDATVLLREYAIPRKVAFVIGSAFHCDDSGKNTMRINFSFATHDKIREGVKRLAEAIEEYREAI
ncbi:MAG: PLP-dependent aminotransferase family protein [bacterium]|nr:PLP-dependent aminotransferase family protein [bacterium]